MTEEAFKPSTIKPKVVFTASSDFKIELSSIHYERVHPDTPEPTPPPAE